MNLSPQFVQVFEAAGIEAVHWATIADPRASDLVIIRWAQQHSCIVFTNDLDFSAILAASNASGPSVIQVRAQNVTPECIGTVVLNAIREYGHVLQEGALITIDDSRARARILPLGELRRS